MRKKVEDFVERGGNMERLGGNLIWKIRIENEGKKKV